MTEDELYLTYLNLCMQFYSGELSNRDYMACACAITNIHIFYFNDTFQPEISLDIAKKLLEAI